MKIELDYRFADEVQLYGEDFWNKAEFNNLSEFCTFQLLLVEHNEKLDGLWSRHPLRYDASRLRVYNDNGTLLLSFGGGYFYDASRTAYRNNNIDYLAMLLEAKLRKEGKR